MSRRDDDPRSAAYDVDLLHAVYEPDGTFTRASGSWRVLGYEPGDLIGRSPFEFCHPSDVPETREAHHELLTQPLAVTVQHRFRRKEGTYVWMETMARGVRDPSGAVTEIRWASYVTETDPEIRDLLDALVDGRLSLQYQPVVDVGDGHATQFEALLRGRRKDDRIVMPAELIPLAERSGLIKPLTAWVLARAIADRGTWPAQATVAVNVSGRNLRDPSLSVEIVSLIKSAQIDPAQLVIELTESAVAAADPEMQRALRHVRDLGVRVALDDFGAGYSSLSKLRRLPFTDIKIDRAICSGVAADHVAEAVVRLTVELGLELGIEVIAEGVEDENQLRALRELGVRQVQGYHVARPMEPADVAAWLGSARPWPPMNGTRATASES